jgi:hypothetical protein
MLLAKTFCRSGVLLHGHSSRWSMSGTIFVLTSMSCKEG